LAFNDDSDDRAVGLTTHHADSRLSVRIPESGRYLLHLGDVQQKGGPEFGYRLRIDRRTPDFELRVTPSSINARAGTTVPLTVHTLRRDGFAGEIALALTAPPEGFELSGGRVPAGQDKVRVTLTVHERAESPQSLVIEGRAAIEGNEIVHTAVPADDMMQAFIYRHLVPAEDLQVAVTGTPSRSTVDVLSNELLKIPAGGTASVPVRIPGRTFFGEVQLELSDPPGGITIESVKQGRWEAEIFFRCDAETAPQDRQGNLIVHAFAVKTDEDSGRGKEQRKKRRILLSTLPAIPFEIVESE
jgi:hypothetical protein